VPAQRERDTARRELGPERWVVREGDDRRSLGDAGERALDVRGRARGAALSASGIARADEGERCAAAPDEVRFVDEHRPELRLAQRFFDGVPAGLDVVVARDHEDAQWCVERA
jgi:hypothetical protein